MRTHFFMHQTESGKIVRCLAEYQEADPGCGIMAGWFVVEVVSGATFDREEAEERFGIPELDRMDDHAARLAQTEYEGGLLERREE